MTDESKDLEKAMNDWADSIARFCRAGIEPDEIHRAVKEAFEKYYKSLYDEKFSNDGKGE